MNNISIIGAGSMGTAVSTLLAKNGHNIRMWTPFKAEADMINTIREHKDKLPGVKVPEGVECTTDLEYSIHKAQLIVFVIPSQTVRQNSKALAKYITEDT
ncbi:MAG: glycerol-3-phosphate dehydrogenase, partial [Clostridiales bacterium]|nr:glycerol-3-phosphate dehydrogenase [Clostridiales bacterium]